MCSVFGGIIPVGEALGGAEMIKELALRATVRGRDGLGFDIKETKRGEYDNAYHDVWPGTLPEISVVNVAVEREIKNFNARYTVVGNARAEPTTEYVKEKGEFDQQPYRLKRWCIAHNGTIANDKEIRDNSYPSTIDSAAIVEMLNEYEVRDPFVNFCDAVRHLKGSFAILAHKYGTPNMFVAVNYRPVWYCVTDSGCFFASARDMLPSSCVPQMLKPYTIAEFNEFGIVRSEDLDPGEPFVNRALVVCSGGLDSVVSAAWAIKQGYQVRLIHFMYGSRAQEPELEAIHKIAKELNVPLTLKHLPVYDKSDSPLLDANSKVAGGEAGAEFAHEWVPARNLLLLAVATAYAEANGYETLVLGNNMEEAGAYPDNEPEFIAKFNDLLPFAIGDGKRLQVIMPVGNMMKHEIVKLGHEVGAPMHLTWSCYRSGTKHCGTCGPCYMRRTAFEINQLPEVIEYEV